MLKLERENGSITAINVRAPIKGESLRVTIFSSVGDGTLYYGREVAHHRDALASGDYCSFLFLFYVPESFAGSFD